MLRSHSPSRLWGLEAGFTKSWACDSRLNHAFPPLPAQSESVTGKPGRGAEPTPIGNSHAQGLTASSGGDVMTVSRADGATVGSGGAGGVGLSPSPIWRDTESTGFRLAVVLGSVSSF